MRELVAEVMALQAEWTSENTAAMARRGELIRSSIPSWIRGQMPALQSRAGYPLAIQGSDGIGLKSQVPWVRIFSPQHSARPTDGWYLVFLFPSAPDRFYLSLGCGATQPYYGGFAPRDPKELAALVEWARLTLASTLSEGIGLVQAIELGGSDLGRAYERGTVAAISYSAECLPPDSQFVADLQRMAALLGRLYKAVDLGQTPVSVPPEIQAAVKAVESISKGDQTTAGQGFGLTARERSVVEQHAMRAASAYLKGNGYSVKDVSKSASYDFEASKEGVTLKVEVKGTTAGLDKILLTANEVKLHEASYPNNALIVVYGIDLKRGDLPTASSGTMAVWHPWELIADSLVPLSYQYQLQQPV